MTTRTLTVLGIEAEIKVPYAEGHALNAQEAGVLNQCFAENVGNNMRREVKEAKDTETDAAAIVKTIQEYATRYHFGMTSSRTTDPVEKQARSIARDVLRNELRKQDRTLDDLTKEERAAEISRIAADERVQALAKKQVKGMDELADLV